MAQASFRGADPSCRCPHQKGPDLILQGHQDHGHENEIGDGLRKYAITGMKKQDSASDSSDDADGEEAPEPQRLAAQLPHLGKGGSQITRTECHRVGDVGRNKGNAYGCQHGKGNKGAASGQTRLLRLRQRLPIPRSIIA